VVGQRGEQRRGAERAAAEQDRHRVAQPALEAASDAVGVARRPSFGRVADGEGAVGLQEDRRGHGRRAVAQLDDDRLRLAVPEHGRSDVDRPEIDGEHVRHRAHSPNHRRAPPRSAPGG
jgi:hypothetical protein